MKKYIKISFIMLLTIFSFNLKASAAEIHANHFELDGNEVYKSGTNGNLWKISIEGVNGSDYWAYCIDYGAIIEKGSAESISLQEYFENGLSSSNAATLAKKINEYIYFGYYGQDGSQSEKYYMATQRLIWQAIYESGFYSSSYYKGRNIDITGIDNLNFQYSGGTAIDVSQEMTAIKKKISTYYQTPSFCSSDSKLEIAVGETATYTDNNGVLSNYKVTCGTGLTCETSGNKLKVTAVNEGADQTITLSKSGAGTGTTVYRISSEYQAAVPTIGKVEPVSCNFGVDTYKNVQTSDIKIISIIFVAILCGIMSYIIYTSKRMLNGLK